MITRNSTPQAAAQPGRPTRENTAVPKTAQSSPHTLSQNRRRRALRAFAGSFPVRTTTHLPSGLRGHFQHGPGAGKRNGRREAGVAAQWMTLKLRQGRVSGAIQFAELMGT